MLTAFRKTADPDLHQPSKPLDIDCPNCGRRHGVTLPFSPEQCDDPWDSYDRGEREAYSKSKGTLWIFVTAAAVVVVAVLIWGQ